MKSTVILLAAAAALILILTACVRNQPNQEDDPPAEPVPSGKTASLSFDSFDGGGPTYSVSIEDPSIASVSEGGAYDDPDHEELDGAGYSVTFVFTGLKPGETYANVSARSPIADNFERRYAVIVAEDLSVTLELLTEEDLNSGAIQPRSHLVLSVNGKVFYPEPEGNSSAQAFLAKLEEEGGSVELELSDYGNFEKVGPLPWELPRNDEKITTVPGDIILYQGDKITIYYDENTWEFTRLARIGNVSKEELLEALGDGDVAVTFWLEWDE